MKIVILIFIFSFKLFCAEQEQEMLEMVDGRPVIANASYYVCKALRKDWCSCKKYKYAFFYTFDGEFLARRSVIKYDDAKIYLDPLAPRPKPNCFSIEFHGLANWVVFYDKHGNRMASAIFLYEGDCPQTVGINVVASHYILDPKTRSFTLKTIADVVDCSIAQRINISPEQQRDYNDKEDDYCCVVQ